MFDFDHRDPRQKEYSLSDDGHTKGIDRLREEALKCDLVCSNCHRMRTHKQRCQGCDDCNSPVAQLAEQDPVKIEVPGSSPGGGALFR